MSIFRRSKPGPPEPVRIARASNLVEAELVEQILADAGIPCLIRRSRGADVADFIAAGNRDILVPASAAEKARELLDQLEASAESLPGS